MVAVDAQLQNVTHVESDRHGGLSLRKGLGADARLSRLEGTAGKNGHREDPEVEKKSTSGEIPLDTSGVGYPSGLNTRTGGRLSAHDYQQRNDDRYANGDANAAQAEHPPGEREGNNGQKDVAE